VVDDLEHWRWIWMGAAVVFLVGEMASPGSFFLVPFAVGAAVATVLAFLDVDLALQWLAFVAVSLAAFAALRPLARRLDASTSSIGGVGANRLVGEVGTVVEPVDDDGVGLVRIDRERWRAEARDELTIDAGTRVRIVEVRGTRVVVEPVAATDAPLA
jgi:membrane protein implicated in regulation of membrane protease activity